MAKVSGYCDGKFNSVRQLLEATLATGDDLGASLCVKYHGETVLDLWGGYADEEKSTEWTRDTLAPVWSSSKLVTNLAALMLVDRGLLDLDANVSLYWPEFAANGKGSIKVRHILSHTAGLSGWDSPTTMSDLYDHDKSTARLAEQKPWWEPGTASGYHAISQGHVVTELVRRVTGTTLKEFINNEIAGPLGADFQLGALEKDWPRISKIVPPPALPFSAPDDGSVASRTLKSSPIQATDSYTEGFRNAELGASNGFGNARSLNTILSLILTNGEVNGKRYLSPATIDRIFEEQSMGVDLVVGIPLRNGIGYGLAWSETARWIPDGKVCFWGGWGGSITIVDLTRGLTISYVMNKMGTCVIGTDRTEAYVKAIYSAVAQDCS
ncbi:beta-lactamase/transpeptidase-like protein [Penicillium nucicola]|uniref:beta-lactamase/transpeptidase-like protein n=1 Tax=Penicillium nucicola TaxID=1850975 RepID=UPI0025451FE2|nr:beta-lactamase/transpeptidase-like protein [Penicillium nucicola]KAJ5747365.1 beta-lactamase/transpeptidase-like protein [Penicillium nucicola]